MHVYQSSVSFDVPETQSKANTFRNSSIPSYLRRSTTFLVRKLPLIANLISEFEERPKADMSKSRFIKHRNPGSPMSMCTKTNIC